MEKPLLRLPGDIKEKIEEKSFSEHKTKSVVIREAILNYYDERTKRHALSWFIKKYCDNCLNREKCPVGSMGFFECLCSKLAHVGQQEEG